jgi:hypothetical protein
MGRSWQFFLTVAVVVVAMAAFYYSSDFYAERAGGDEGAVTEAQGAPAEAPAAEGDLGLIPTNE